MRTDHAGAKSLLTHILHTTTAHTPERFFGPLTGAETALERCLT
jgi:hypothetical protein